MKKRNRNKVAAATLMVSMLQAPFAGSYALGASTEVSITAVSLDEKSANAQHDNAQDESQAKITKEEAVERIIKLFPEFGKEARVESVQFGNPSVFPPPRNLVWTINWVIEKGNSSHGFNSEVDAMTGDLLQFYHPISEQDQVYYPPKVSYEEGEKLARAFVKKASPSIAKYKLVPMDNSYNESFKPLFGSVRYSYSYNLLVNGIPSDGSSLHLTLNGNGEVVSYHANYAQGDYPSSDTKLSAAEAEKKFKDELALTLFYIPDKPYYDRSPNSEWSLGYFPAEDSLLPLDAKTGDRVQNHPVAQNRFKGYIPIPKSAVSFVAHTGKTLTQDEAKARALKIVTVPADYKAHNAYLSKDWYGGAGERPVWRFTWSKDDRFGYMNQLSVVIDANNGQLLELNDYDYVNEPPSEEEAKDKPQASITSEQARSKALTLIHEIYPNAAEKLRLIEYAQAEDGNKTATFSFIFQQFHEDIPLYASNVHLVLDGDGKLKTYNDASSLMDKQAIAKLEKLTAKLEPDKALEAYRDVLSAELRYTQYGGYYDPNNYIEPVTKLAYVPLVQKSRQFYYVNAMTGKLVLTYPYGSEAAAKPKASDLAGHWAERELTTMVEYGVLEPDAEGLVRPDKNLTLGDWMKMVMASFNPSQSYYNYYSSNSSSQPYYSDVAKDSPYAEAVSLFVSREWLKPSTPEAKLNPEQTLTRGQLALLLTQFLNYDALSVYMNKDQQVASLKDAASIPNPGAAAIALKLGLLTASGGSFKPDAPVTRAQASVILMRLVYLQGKVDTPIMG
ncbi:YcdB/YcdC domain-containing protein [Paenibacillus sp. GCM10023252]|uniref:YcdB/YcdC domain-containing protein n=1 Tax=Paenibacillus sp. GCM10023252 TaxID=3252649 RepID=UPI00361E1B8A